MNPAGAIKYLHVAKVSFRNKAVYTLDVLAGSVFYILILYIFVQLWSYLIGTGRLAIPGYGVRELVWYMVASEGIMLARGRIEQETDEEIKSGSIAYMLNKPYNYVLFKLAAYWGDTALKLMINAVVGALFAWLIVGPISISAARLPQVALCVVLGLTLNYFINMSIAVMAFWVEDTTPFFWIYGKTLFILGGLFAPMEMYPQALARLARATPFHYIIYGPARLLVSYEPALFARTVTIQAAWVATLAAALFGLYGLGMKRLHVNGG